jgi:hypothetical protein
MKDPIPFTDTERFLVSYYRTPSVSSWHRTLAADGGYLTASAFLVALYLNGFDAGWGFVGYGILFYRVVVSIWHARRWGPAFEGIVTKYEARIAELSDAVESAKRGDVTKVPNQAS